MQRFYFPNLEKKTDNITIKNKQLINQLIKVLRVKNWYELAFFNWIDNFDQIYKIISIDKREIYLEKVWIIQKNSEIDFDLNIFWALPNKLEKIEFILKKWVEIWITGFYFFKSKRSQKLNLSENKITRLKKIIIESSEQSQRSRIPELIIEDNICLSDFEKNENIFFDTNWENSKNLKEVNFSYEKWINLFIWPEWWFCEEEKNIFKQNWFKKVFLWERILRTETTWIVAWFFIIQNR